MAAPSTPVDRQAVARPTNAEQEQLDKYLEELELEQSTEQQGLSDEDLGGFDGRETEDEAEGTDDDHEEVQVRSGSSGKVDEGANRGQGYNHRQTEYTLRFLFLLERVRSLLHALVARASLPLPVEFR